MIDLACADPTLVIYFYERILTFAQETKVIWLSKNTGLVIPVAYASIHLCTALNLLLGICTPTELHCKVRLLSIPTNSMSHVRLKHAVTDGLHSQHGLGRGRVHPVRLLGRYVSVSSGSISKVDNQAF